MQQQIRLNKLIAEQLGLSRREADDYITAGRVLVNGASATLGTRITRNVDVVSIDGTPLTTSLMNFTYLILNKPVNYVCSRRQQGDTPTIYELIPKEYHYLKPVGRLDKDSSGLILLTNDGDFAHSMTHPSFYKNKVYFVTLDTPLQPLHQQMINDHGIQLDDGNSQLNVTSITDTTEAGQYPKNTYKVEMSEGRNRQIRRTFAALGYEVVGLHRTQFGNYLLNDIEPGEYVVTKAL